MTSRETITTLQEKYRDYRILQLFIEDEFADLTIFIYWGRGSQPTLTDIVQSKLNDVNDLYNAIINLVNKNHYKEFNYKTQFDKQELPLNNSRVDFLLSLFTSNKRFPNTSKTDKDLCIFLRNAKLSDPAIISDYKQKIEETPFLLLKLYYEYMIKTLQEKYYEINIDELEPEPELDTLMDQFNNLKGGKYFFDKPSLDDTKCWDLYDIVQKNIANEMTESHIDWNEAYKIVRNKLTIAELKLLNECKISNKVIKSKDRGGVDLIMDYEDDEEDLDDRSFYEEKENFINLINVNKKKDKIKILIKLFKLVEDHTKDFILNELKGNYDDKRKEILSKINHKYIENGKLNALGISTYNSFSTDYKIKSKIMPTPSVERFRSVDHSVDHSVDFDSPNPPSPPPILERGWVPPPQRIVRNQGIKNAGNTCYMNALLQAINGTDYLYIQLLTDIHNSKLLIPVIRYFDDTLRALRINPNLLNIENKFCTQVWRLVDNKGNIQFPPRGQEDSIVLFNVIVDKIREGLFENSSSSPITDGIVQPLKKLDGMVEGVTIPLQQFIDAHIAYNIAEKNKDKKKLFDEYKMYIEKLLNTKKEERYLYTNNPENPFFAIDSIKELAIANNIDELNRLKYENDRELSKKLAYGLDESNMKKLNQTRKSIKNALNAIEINQAKLLSEEEENPNYIPNDILKMNDAVLQQGKKIPFVETTFQTLKPDETILHTKDYKPFIILENPNKIKTTKNCDIIIEDQHFVLKSVIIKTGNAQGGHYYTITPEGEFNDDRFKPSETQFPNFCTNGDANATFYFFENIKPPLQKPIALEGGSIKNKYFHKYLKYKNKYLELSKLKQKKLGRK